MCPLLGHRLSSDHVSARGRMHFAPTCRIAPTSRQSTDLCAAGNRMPCRQGAGGHCQKFPFSSIFCALFPDAVCSSSNRLPTSSCHRRARSGPLPQTRSTARLRFCDSATFPDRHLLPMASQRSAGSAPDSNQLILKQYLLGAARKATRSLDRSNRNIARKSRSSLVARLGTP